VYLSPINTQDLYQFLIKEKLHENETFCLYFSEKSNVEIADLIKLLNKSEIPFFGAIFPAVIHNGEHYDNGVVISKLKNVVSTHLVQGLDQNKMTIPEFKIAPNKNYCALTFVDGLAPNISLFLSEMYDKYGKSISYLGGGAGSLSFVQKPCLFFKDGFYDNAALIVIVETQVSLGVTHGWKKLKGPLVATKTNKNVIEEINWEPAFLVYQKYILEDSGKEITKDNFFSIAKGYPFGMHKDYAECIVRDPIATDVNNRLVCVGEVPENTVLDLLKGEQSALINAAENAAMISRSSASSEVNNVILIDCISRTLFLEDHFSKELTVIGQELKKSTKNQNLAGALTLGEISSYGNGNLEFFNKTTVVGLFHE